MAELDPERPSRKEDKSTASIDTFPIHWSENRTFTSLSCGFVALCLSLAGTEENVVSGVPSGRRHGQRFCTWFLVVDRNHSGVLGYGISDMTRVPNGQDPDGPAEPVLQILEPSSKWSMFGGPWAFFFGFWEGTC